MNNIKINKKSKKVDISLNKKFYSIKAVKQASQDFKDICNCTIPKNKNIEISLKLKEDLDINTIGYEFCNYVLALMKNETLV